MESRKKHVLFLIIFLVIAVIISYSIEEKYSGGEVVILTYHDIVKGKPEKDSQVNVVDFDEQMRYLFENDYNVLSLEEFLKYYKQGSFPEKSVMITFDDGYKSYYIWAYPILKKFNFDSVVFPVVGSTPGLEKHEVWKRHLTFHEMRLMIKESGLVDVGSHTFNLHSLDQEGKASIEKKDNESLSGYVNRVRRDLRASKDVLELETSREVKTLAWPYGRSTYLAEEIAEEVGYEVFFTVYPGVCTPKTSLENVPRFIVDKGELSVFKKIVESPRDYTEEVKNENAAEK